MFTTTARITRRALAGFAILLPLLLLVTALAAGVCGQTWATLSSSPLLVTVSGPTPAAPAVPASAAPAETPAVAPAAVCGSDTACALWAQQHSQTADPLVDDRGEPFCLPGASLYDTETPAVGDEGVVCTPDTQPSSQAVSQPTEDSPTFDCRLDGDLQCGTGVAGGPIWKTLPDGSFDMSCPGDGDPIINGAGVPVCSYGQST